MQWQQLIDLAKDAWCKRDLKATEMRLFQALRLLELTSTTYDARLLPTLELLTEILLKQEKILAAEPQLLKLLDAQMRLPDVTKLAVAKTLQRLAEVAFYQLSYSRAINFGSRSLILFLDVFGKNHLEVAQAAHKLANYYRASGNNEQAEIFYRQSIDSLAHANNDDCANVDTLIASYASFLEAMHRAEEAEHLIRSTSPRVAAKV